TPGGVKRQWNADDTDATDEDGSDRSICFSDPSSSVRSAGYPLAGRSAFHCFLLSGANLMRIILLASFLAVGLTAVAADPAPVVRCHRYDDLDKDPDHHLPRLAGLRKQIAERYRDRPAGVVFELYNEPHDKLTDERWQQGFPEVLKAVRASNPRRAVVIGPG